MNDPFSRIRQVIRFRKSSKVMYSDAGTLIERELGAEIMVGGCDADFGSKFRSASDILPLFP